MYSTRRLTLVVCFCGLSLGTSIAQQKETKEKKLKEVVVRADKRPTSINSISSKINTTIIDESIGQSLASMLERVSGLSSIQTGVNTAKPVIHGMHGNRILIVNNGARQNGQQWGEGHAPELDMNSSQSIYVVKGAESVRYGSEAMGGVIVMEQKGLPYHQPMPNGKVNQQFATNGKRYGLNALVEGSIPSLPRLGWRVQGSYSNSGDRYTGDYVLNNTGEREKNFALALGYEWNKRLNTEIFYSRYDSQHGVMKAAQLGNASDFEERIKIGQPLVFEPWSRKIDYPREHVIHHNLTARSEYTHPKWGRWRYQFTYQDDQRKEYRIRRNNNSHIPEVDLRLQSQQHQLRWNLDRGSWHSEAGLQYQHINNFSIAGNGVTPIIPNYVENSWGAYAVERYSAMRWSLELGVRADGQHTSADGYNIVGQRYGGSRKFTNFTYSLGGRYRLSNGLFLKTNFGAAWRAPHVHELYSNGHDHGSAAFVRGDDKLNSEQSYKWVSSLTYTNNWLNISLDGYLQWVKNYIYDMPIVKNGQAELITVLSGSYPLFQFMQTDAFFRGLDLEASVEINPWLSYELRTALIFANERQTGAYLPYIPPMRIDHNLNIKLPKLLGTEKSELELGHRFVSKQTRFDPNKDLTTETPAAYHLFNAELSLSWALQKWGKSISLRLIGENILNKHYKEYTNRARYYSHDLGRDIRLQISYHF